MFGKMSFREFLSDKLFEYEHPIASSMMMPVTVFFLFIFILWTVSAVGRHGIIPAVALVICIIAMHVFYGKVSHGLMFIWIQPFICYAELIFIKYVFKANDTDPGVGLMGWIIFAGLTVLLFWHTADFLDIMDSTWGIAYLLPFALAWIFSLTHQHYVYYIVIYLLIFALVMTLYTSSKRKKNKNFELAEGSTLAAVLLVMFSLISILHAMLRAENIIPKSAIDMLVSLLEMSEI